jgi:uncharacterized protein YsxB (DUF464 family)
MSFVIVGRIRIRVIAHPTFTSGFCIVAAKHDISSSISMYMVCSAVSCLIFMLLSSIKLGRFLLFEKCLKLYTTLYSDIHTHVTVDAGWRQLQLQQQQAVVVVQ